MATNHILLGMSKRAAAESSSAVALAGRSKLTAVLALAAVTGSLSVVIEASATGAEGTFTTLATFNALNTPGVTTKVPADIVVQPYHRVVRARITDITDATFELILTAPWVDATVDAALFTKELRSFSEVARILSDAEDVVMEQLLPRVNTAAPERAFTPETVDTIARSDAEALAGLPHARAIDADTSLPGFATAIRTAIIRQAEHLFHRHKLSQSSEPAALVSLRQFPSLAPGLMDGLARFRKETSTTWRGR